MNGHINSTGDDEQNNAEDRQVKPHLKVKVPQPIRLRNHLLEEENYDTLHSQTEDVAATPCSEKVCLSSIMSTPGHVDSPRTTEEIYKEAQDFLKQFYASIGRENTKPHLARLQEVKNELLDSGTYQLKTVELVFGAKLAWRNAPRCIGRIQWKKLQVFDCREVTTASGMFDALCTHIKYATNKGNIRSALTVFPQRTDGKHDYKIWNPQLISYAGYRQADGTVIGDAMRVEITEVCINLGWKPPKTNWDILPIVLSADGKDPEFFDIPREIVMEIQMVHPTFDWFQELGLKWYALPAVSGMRFDCGGLEFTANVFNGWYMSTEIACRNLCDTYRFNIIETVATKMGLDTSSTVSLWKDRALVEVNVAVLHSFHKENATIVDHHAASEGFMKHLENENRTRGGCPSDWIWIVPPLSSSLTPVFHQEMALYYIRPSFDYQEAAWKTHQWTKSEGKKSINRKFHFRQIAKVVKFTSKLFARALSKRIKVTILYATETGKSEHYAKEVGTIFGHAFNAQVHCMSEYDMFSIEHETLLLIVTSTFGNGEPPANGMDFLEYLLHLLSCENNQGNQTGNISAGSVKTPTPRSLMRGSSMLEVPREYKKQLSRLESIRSSGAASASSVDQIGPLSNVRFAVFALGSSAYPKFCHFGKNIDSLLGQLGGDRMLDVVTGDEMCGQEQQFRQWASDIFQLSCETFCLDDSEMVQEARRSLGVKPLSEETVRFWKPSGTVMPLKAALEAGFKKHLVSCTVQDNRYLGDRCTERATIFVDMEPHDEVKYDPGDHVGILACNRKEIVDAVLDRLKDVDDFDKPLQLQLMKEKLTHNGAVKSWEPHERLPAVSVRELFTRFLDITTPPSATLLEYFSTTCSNEEDEKELKLLATDSNKYDDWRHFNYPTLSEVLAEFPSVEPQTSLLVALLSPLQPRFYSISSSPLAHTRRIHITVAIVVYKTQGGEGPTHYGVCSTYLQSLKQGDEVFAFIRRAASFHLPKDLSAPLILVGPGTGIAPFRGFWHHRRHEYKSKSSRKVPGPIWLFFGCRTRGVDLYKDEKEQAIADGVLTKVSVALSREEGVPKKYVQALLEEASEDVCEMLLERKGHFYVCGDCKMAEDVQQKLKGIIMEHARMNEDEVSDFIATMMDENRYHEDIFGITLRTAEVHSASMEFARKRRLESTTSLP